LTDIGFCFWFFQDQDQLCYGRFFLDFGLGLIGYQSTSDTKITSFSGLYNGNNALIFVYGNYLEVRKSTKFQIEKLR
jgi:hypothetical protein